MRYSIQPIWHLIFALLVMVIFASSAAAQIPNKPLAGLSQMPPALSKVPEVKIGSEGPIPTVSVWHPSFEMMCRDLAKQLGVESAKMIHLTPKPMLPSRDRYRGDVWIAESGDRQVEVSAAQLPMALRGLRGPAAEAIHLGTCYLKDNHFYSTEHVVFITLPSQVQALVSGFR